MANTWTRCRHGALHLLAVVLLAGCAGNTQQQAPKPQEKKYEVYTVEIKDMKFVPDTVNAKAGDEVVFVNRDMVTHCVTELDSNAWTSSALPSGQSYLLVAKKSCNYYCAIHKVMKGCIVVQ